MMHTLVNECGIWPFMRTVTVVEEYHVIPMHFLNMALTSILLMGVRMSSDHA